MDYLIQMKHFTNTQTTKMLDTNVTDDDKSHSYETPRKNNHSSTAQSFHVQLKSDSLQCQHDIPPKMTCKNFLHMESSIFVFRLTEQLPKPHSFPKQ